MQLNLLGDKKNGPTTETARGPIDAEVNPASACPVGQDRPQRAGVVARGHQTGERTRAKDLTAERLRELLVYDPETGDFINRVSRDRAVKGTVAGSKAPNDYTRIRIDRELHRAQRLVWLYHFGHWPSGEIDHMNGDRADNRLCNLRDVSKSVNQQNQRRAHPSNTTGVLGVHWHKKYKKFYVSLSVNGKTKHIGQYDSVSDASAAHIAAKRLYHPGCQI